MKKLIAAAVAGLAIAGAGTAHADPSADAKFLALLAQYGFESGNGSQGMITAGHQVCADITASGATSSDELSRAGVAEAARLQSLNPALTSNGAMQFVAAAVVTLCPWNAPRGTQRGTSV